MPPLVATPMLTPEEEYLLNLEAAAAAEPVPPPVGAGMAYPTGVAAVPPPPVAAPPPADTAMYSAPVEPAYQPGGSQYLPMGGAPPAYTPDTPTPTIASEYYGGPASAIPTPSSLPRVDTPLPLVDTPRQILPSVAERVRAAQAANGAPAAAPYQGIPNYREPSGAPSDPLADYFLDAADEGVSWNAILDPGSWLPEPRREYDAEGNEIVGRGEGAFITGPPIVSSRARAMGPRTSPAGTGSPVRPSGRSPAASEPVPPPVVTPVTTGPQTFPRLAGRPGSPAGGGGFWGPKGEIIYPRGSAIPSRPPIALPAEAIPPPGPVRVTTGRPVFGQAAGEVIPVPAATGRPVLGQAGAGIGVRSALRGTTAPTRTSGPGTGGSEIPVDVAPPVSTTAPAASTAARADRGLRPSKRGLAAGAAAAVGAGAVGSRLLEDRGNAPSGAITPEPSAAPAPLEPGIYSPSTNPRTPDEWTGATTRALELLKGYSPQEWGAGTKRTAVEIGGVPQKLIESTTVPGLYVGYVDVNGNIVPVGNEVSPEAFQELVIANAAEAEPGWGDAAPVPAPDGASATPATTTGTTDITPGATLADVSVPAPSGTGGGSSRSSGGGSYRPSGGGYSRDDDGARGFGGGFGRGYEDEFTADDFMEQAGGNRRKAEFMAKAANRRRRRRGGDMQQGGGMWPGFPFDRPPSPIRDLVLSAIAESQAEGRARKQQR